MEKLCRHCNQTKDTSEFPKDKSKKDGFNAYCKPCAVERQRKFFSRPPRFTAPEGFKKCQHCKEILALEQFNIAIGSHDGYAKKCKPCAYKFTDRWRKNNLKYCADKMKEKRARNPERFKDYGRKHRYGLPYEEYDKLLAAQNGRCAVCNTDTPGVKGFHVDHCHTTGKIRGLLCHHCNVLIGHAKENVEILLAAISYLQKERGSEDPLT